MENFRAGRIERNHRRRPESILNQSECSTTYGAHQDVSFNDGFYANAPARHGCYRACNCDPSAGGRQMAGAIVSRAPRASDVDRALKEYDLSIGRLIKFSDSL